MCPFNGEFARNRFLVADHSAHKSQEIHKLQLRFEKKGKETGGRLTRGEKET